LFDWANQRKEPIPVFAEMSSINPVFLLPQKLKASAKDIAGLYAGSITLGVGQFCTNPGLVIGIEGNDLDDFMQALGNEIKRVAPAKMLHPGIAKSFTEKRAKALSQSSQQRRREEADVCRAYGATRVESKSGRGKPCPYNVLGSANF